jgi:hypothetical protein
MKDPGLPPEKFVCDVITDRQLLFEECGYVTSINQIRKTFPCSMRDLSSFNQISFTATNHTELILYGEMKLFHGSGKTDVVSEPISLSGGRECLLPGETVELIFPQESFGTYGKPEGWKDIAAIEVIVKREKTDVSDAPIAINIGAVYGEYREIPAGPRLRDRGLEAMPDRCLSEKNRSLKLLSIPSYHPYPHEKADEILKGWIMGVLLPFPVPWNESPSGILEWSHFLHRHHFLREVLKSFLETKDSSCIRFLSHVIHDWIVHNPVPVESNGGAGPSWETLSAAWRLREWLWIKGIAWSCSVFKEETKALMLRSLWEHCRHLMDHKGHPNNWIIVESAALALAGIYLIEFKEAGQWLEEGVGRLEKEFGRQFMEDGVHFELSPLYHAICIHAFLEVKITAAARNIVLPEIFGSPLEKAAGYLASLCRPDFTWPSLNDSGGIAGDYCAIMELAGELFNRSDFIWIGTKGQKGVPPAETVHIYPDAGIGMIRSGYEEYGHYLLMRAGPAGMTHVHEDVLSLDVAVCGKPCLVDPGITAYAPGPLTDHYRSAPAHNMILIDGKGPVRSQLGFQERVMPAKGNLSVTLSERDSESLAAVLTGICDDYFNESGIRFIVTRKVIFTIEKYWIIEDSIEGSGAHTVTVCWQFSPGEIRIDSDTSAICFRNNEGRGLDLIPVIKGHKFNVFHSKGDMEPSPSGWVSLNGKDVAANYFRFSLTCPLPLMLTWKLYPIAKTT